MNIAADSAQTIFCRPKQTPVLRRKVFNMKGAVTKMGYDSEANQSIKCNVNKCKNHCSSENYCSLNCITVGTHEANPTMDQCTDCQSFVAKQG
jgi:Domain of Unknown Function (DUF1540).